MFSLTMSFSAITEKRFEEAYVKHNSSLSFIALCFFFTLHLTFNLAHVIKSLLQILFSEIHICCLHAEQYGWMGRAMVLGSFQCRGVLLLWHMVGQGPAVLAAGAGQVGYFLFFIFFISSIISSFPNASSVGRRLDILKYCGLIRYNPAVVVSYDRRRVR